MDGPEQIGAVEALGRLARCQALLAEDAANLSSAKDSCSWVRPPFSLSLPEPIFSSGSGCAASVAVGKLDMSWALLMRCSPKWEPTALPLTGERRAGSNRWHAPKAKRGDQSDDDATRSTNRTARR